MTSVVVDDNETWRVKTLGLMSQHVGAFHISVVGHTDTGVHLPIFVQVLQNLDSFGAWCCTHV